MKFFTLSIMTLTLVACTTTDVVTKPVPVEIPVEVPCKIKPIPVPQWDTQGVTDKTPMPQQVKALEAVNEQHKAYEVSLNGAIKSCQ